MKALVMATFLLASTAPAMAQPSSAGTGDLGAVVQAGNRDCPPRGSERRLPSPVARPGAVTCAPTGSGPATGYVKAPSTPPPSGSGSPAADRGR